MGDQNTQQAPLTRRTVAKGIAWSLPAITLAAPALAVATSPLVTFDPLGTVCKYPGLKRFPGGVIDKGYIYPVQVTNSSNEAVTVKALSGYVDLGLAGRQDGTPAFWDGPPQKNGKKLAGAEFTLEPGETGTFYFVIEGASNSSQSGGTAYLKVNVKGKTTGRSYDTTTTLTFASSPPCE